MGTRIGNKAVLVYPKFLTDTFWSFERSYAKYTPKNKFGLPKRSLPPLGMMGLYRHLKEKGYYDEVVLIDRNVDPRPLENLVRDADHVFMGGMIAQQQGFFHDARIIKGMEKTLIAGGTIVDPNSSTLMDLADHMIENEAEMVIDGLLRGLADGSAKKFYKGITTSPEKYWQPDFSSIDLGSYSSMAIQISRGCPFDCEFCDITTRFGKKPRTSWEKNTEQSLEEMYGTGWRGPVFIVDDNFIGNPERAIEVLKSIHKIEARLGHQFPKYTELSMNLADDSKLMKELRYWLHETNFVDCFIGVETSNVEALKETRKGQNLRGERSITEKLELISQETGMKEMAGMILGFDADTDYAPEEMIQFINNTPVPTVMVGLLQALPYTKLWDRMKKEGRLKIDPEEGVANGNVTEAKTNFIPYNFSAKQAEQHYARILEGIYNEDAYFGRVMKSLEIINPIVKSNHRKLKDSIYAAATILTRENSTIYRRHLKEAHEIGKRRFGAFSEGHKFVIAQYLEFCAKYTHLRHQTEQVREKIATREYEPWQEHSWKSMQESPIAEVEVVTDNHKDALMHRIKMKLHNGYEFIGTRMEALGHFLEPYLKKGLQGLTARVPSAEDFIEVELQAYSEVHEQRPKIIGNFSFSEVAGSIREMLVAQPDYLSTTRQLLRAVKVAER